MPCHIIHRPPKVTIKESVGSIIKIVLKKEGKVVKYTITERITNKMERVIT
jgi:hypothetical protein